MLGKLVRECKRSARSRFHKFTTSSNDELLYFGNGKRGSLRMLRLDIRALTLPRFEHFLLLPFQSYFQSLQSVLALLHVGVIIPKFVDLLRQENLKQRSSLVH